MHDKLKEILAHKESEVKALLPRMDKLRFSALERNEFRSFSNALKGAPGQLQLIAEVKKASPSAGEIVSDEFDPIAVARAYEAAGAHAISVLTDEKFFQGSLSYLARIRSAVSLPLLRKDFIIHEAQIYEAVVAGADAILLIAAALPQERLEQMLVTAESVQLDVLVEVHSVEELDRVLSTDAQIIGINNRDLHTFHTDIHTTERLSKGVDDGLIMVSESGIYSANDARLIYGWGADAILVGESLMRAPDVAALAADLIYAGEPAGDLSD